MFILIMLAGCAGGAANSNTPESNDGADSAEGIGFEYFYRGFTPLEGEKEASAFEEATGIVIIRTQDDLRGFMSTYCPGFAYLMTDFSESCLIAVSEIYGSGFSYNASSEIKTIKIVNNRVEVIVDDEQNLSERIYALNTSVSHWYVNIVRVNKDDLPEGIEGSYN